MIIIERSVKLTHLCKEEALSGMTFTGESSGHKFVITQVDEPGTKVPLTGSVSGKFLRSDGTTIALAPSEGYAGIEDGSAWVVLAGNCYTHDGPFRLIITNVKGSERTDIYAFTGYVRLAETDTVVDPENVINIDAIAAMMDDCETATEAAEAAAAFVPNVIAPAYSASATYAVGDYVTKDGYLYRCNTAISTAEAWTAAHWTRVTTGGEVGDLKSATSTLFIASTGSNLWKQGTPTSASSSVRVTTVSPVNDIYSIAPTEGVYFSLYAVGQGYLKSDGTFVDSAANAKRMESETVIQPLMAPFAQNNYTWYAVAALNSGSSLTTSDVAGFVLTSYRLNQIENRISEQDEFWGVEKSENLFDKNDITLGKYITVANGQAQYVDDSNMFYSFVPLPSAGTYSFLVSRKFFGNSANKIRMFNANNAYVASLTATLDSSDNTDTVVAHITVSDQYYNGGYKKIGITNAIYVSSLMMVVSGDTYPEDYIPFVDGPTVPTLQNPALTESSRNTLYRKKVVFDGDSICNAASEGIPRLGWAGRIGIDADMEWYNEGVSGATVTPDLGASKSILTTFETIHNKYASIDYYIFDGGVNDADRMYTDVETNLGTITPNDYSGSYNTATFSGAFETLIYKALTYYPHIKLGYIVAQKMHNTVGMERYTIKRTFFDRAIEICKKWGVPYLDLWDGSTLNPFLTADYDSTMTTQENIEAGKMYVDGQHLTPAGYDAIAPKIEAWMKTL